MAWHKTIQTIQPHVVKIETPSGHGTGFFFGRNASGAITAIATAAHVVDHADAWREPIKVSTATDVVYLEHDDRVIFLDESRDSAVSTVNTQDISFPKQAIPLCSPDDHFMVGAAIGWLGYPGIAPASLCFFRGYVSAWVEHGAHYLVDGVAIHGVSGGPVFDDSAKPEILGLVSAYHPNRQAGATLPGLLRCQDMTWMHEIVERFRTFDEARKAEAARKADPSADQGSPPKPQEG